VQKHIKHDRVLADMSLHSIEWLSSSFKIPISCLNVHYTSCTISILKLQKHTNKFVHCLVNLIGLCAFNGHVINSSSRSNTVHLHRNPSVRANIKNIHIASCEQLLPNCHLQYRHLISEGIRPHISCW